MAHYRNRPDRRVAGPNPVQPIINPIMLFSCTPNSSTKVDVLFDQEIADVDLTDPAVLASVNVWHPAAGYQGIAESAIQGAPDTIRFTFGAGNIAGEDSAVIIVDGSNYFRGRTTGARCTGNPGIFEAV